MRQQQGMAPAQLKLKTLNDNPYINNNGFRRAAAGDGFRRAAAGDGFKWAAAGDGSYRLLQEQPATFICGIAKPPLTYKPGTANPGLACWQP